MIAPKMIAPATIAVPYPSQRPRPAPPPGLLRGRPVMLAAVTGMVLVSLAIPGLPTAASGTPAESSSDALQLELIDQDFAFGPDGDLHLEYRLTGDFGSLADLRPPQPTTTIPEPPDGEEPVDPPPEPPPPIALTIQVANYPPIDSTDSIERYVGADVDPADFQDAIDGVLVADVRDLARFHDDGSVTFTLNLPTDVVDSQPDKLKFDRPGLYPLRVQLRVGDIDQPDAVTTHGTIVQRLPGVDEGIRPAEPIDLALVAAIDDPGPLADDAVEARADDELVAIAAAAGAVTSSFTLALPPSVAVPATADPTDQQRLSEQLADDELVALPAVPFDVSAATAADKLDRFALELRIGEDLLTSALPTVPSRRDVWIATAPLSADGAQALRDLGTRMVVMTPELYLDTVDRTLPATDQFVEIALPDGGALPLLVADPLGIEFTEEATTATLEHQNGTEWSVTAISRLVLEQQAGSASVQRSRAIATPDLTAPDPRLLIALERMAATTPGVRFSPASALTGLTDVQRNGSDPVRVELPAIAGPSITERVSLLTGTAFVMANAASMLAPDDPRAVEWIARLDMLVSTGYPDGYVEAEVAEMIAEADELTGAVVPPEPFTFTLTGKSGDIDMRLGNTGEETLTVKLRLSSPKLTFPEGEQTVELRPGAETSVIVPVRARANGTSLVTVEILTPLDQPLTEPVLVTSRVNALTGLGQVLTGGLIVVLLSWWFSHWRSRRKAAAANEETEAPDTGGPDTGGPDTTAPATTGTGLPPPGE